MRNLVWAIKNGDLDQVKLILEKNEQKIDLNEQIDGRVPLHYAADYGQTAVIKYLLANGANPNMNDKHGISVILAAIWEGHTECVKLLLDNGASKSGQTPDGQTYIQATESDAIRRLLM